MSDVLLVLNAGSSSLKFAIFAADGRESLRSLERGEIEGLGHKLRLTARDASGEICADEVRGSGDAGHRAALEIVLDRIAGRTGAYRLAAAGHRVAHGGSYPGPVAMDAEVMKQLRRFAPFVPSHQPHNLAAIEALRAIHPGLFQVACFDTSFHRSQPRLARLYALPRAMIEAGLHGYGFHGLSYEYVAGVLPDLAGGTASGRVVVAHLGHGASMCAMRGLESVATTMGFSALDGLPMGRRCGALDPGIPLYLMAERGMDPAAVTELLYERSGLLGVSGLSDDMRELLASPDPHAREAVDLFAYRAARELGSLAAALGGLDVLVFTGGIGEHAAPVREKVCALAAWLGVQLDGDANRRGGPRISTPGSRIPVFAVQTDEEIVIARHTHALLSRRATGEPCVGTGRAASQRQGRVEDVGP